MKLMFCGTFVILLTISVYLSWKNLFCKKYNIKTELVFTIPSKDGFMPLAYEFFHSEKCLQKYFVRTESTKCLLKYIEPIADSWDFNNYSYCLVYGKPIQRMFYSRFDCNDKDITPSYAKIKGTIFVSIEYGECESANYIYIYKLERNPRYRGAGI